MSVYLFTTNWLKGVVCRVILFMLPVQTLLLMNRGQKGDANFGEAWLYHAGFVCLVETSVYISMKARVRLFYKVKQLEK